MSTPYICHFVLLPVKKGGHREGGGGPVYEAFDWRSKASYEQEKKAEKAVSKSFPNGDDRYSIRKKRGRREKRRRKKTITMLLDSRQ